MSATTVVIGDALIDELVDETGTTRIVGGSALNVATGLRVLGRPASLIAMIGDDADGALIRAHLASYGIELLPTISPLGTGIARSVRVDGEPSYHFSEAMQRRRLAFDDAQRAAIADAAVVAVSGFPFDDADQAEALGEAVAGARGTVAVDPNPRAGMLRDADAFRLALEGFARVAELLKLGGDDARLLYELSVRDVAPALAQHYRALLVTEGAEGAGVRIGEARHVRPARLGPRGVVDTMGAGDAVFATVLAGLGEHGLEQIDWERTLERAMAVASATIAEPGALLRLPD